MTMIMIMKTILLSLTLILTILEFLNYNLFPENTGISLYLARKLKILIEGNTYRFLHKCRNLPNQYVILLLYILYLCNIKLFILYYILVFLLNINVKDSIIIWLSGFHLHILKGNFIILLKILFICYVYIVILNNLTDMIQCGVVYLFDIIKTPELLDSVNSFQEKYYESFAYEYIHNILIDIKNCIIQSLVTLIQTIISNVYLCIKEIITIIITPFDYCFKLLELLEPNYMYLDSIRPVNTLKDKLFEIRDIAIHLANAPRYNEIMVIRGRKPPVGTISIRIVLDKVNNTYSFGSETIEYLLVMQNNTNAFTGENRRIGSFLINPRLYCQDLIDEPGAIGYDHDWNIVFNTTQGYIQLIPDFATAVDFSNQIETECQPLSRILPSLFEKPERIIPRMLMPSDLVHNYVANAYNNYRVSPFLTIRSNLTGHLVFNNSHYPVKGLQFNGIPWLVLNPDFVEYFNSIGITDIYYKTYVFYTPILDTLIYLSYMARGNTDYIDYMVIFSDSNILMRGWKHRALSITSLEGSVIVFNDTHVNNSVALRMRDRCDFMEGTKRLNFDRDQMPKLILTEEFVEDP